jgi:inosine/xanthosine triphosphate pyrophosphatase family protein
MVMKKLEGMNNPTIREARYHTVIACIENGIWVP